MTTTATTTTTTTTTTTETAEQDARLTVPVVEEGEKSMDRKEERKERRRKKQQSHKVQEQEQEMTIDAYTSEVFVAELQTILLGFLGCLPSLDQQQQQQQPDDEHSTTTEATIPIIEECSPKRIITTPVRWFAQRSSAALGEVSFELKREGGTTTPTRTDGKDMVPPDGDTETITNTVLSTHPAGSMHSLAYESFSLARKKVPECGPLSMCLSPNGI